MIKKKGSMKTRSVSVVKPAVEKIEKLKPLVEEYYEMNHASYRFIIEDAIDVYYRVIKKEMGR